MARWLWNLGSGVAVGAGSEVLSRLVGAHLAIGTVIGVVYARYFRPILPGPEWARGCAFALLPWLISVTVLLPLVGGGLLGLSLGAGPLPIVGSLGLHLLYGSVLGWTYRLVGWTLRQSALSRR